MRSPVDSLVLVRVLGLFMLSVASGCGGDEELDETPSTSDSTDQADAGDTDESPNDGTTAAETGDTDDTGDTGDETSSSSDTDDTSGSVNTTDTTTDESTEDPTTGDPHISTVGVACDEDADCAEGLLCLTESEELGGALPASGICTIPCADNDGCWAHDEFSLCVDVGTSEAASSYCMQACYFGSEDSSKCAGLAQSACYPLDSELQADGTVIGACFPQCHSDADCDSDAYCDTWSGLCVDEPLPGKAPGELCDLDADQDECGSGGSCMGIADGISTGFCTVNCNMHVSTLICGDDAPGPEARAVCYPHVQIFSALQALSSVNDVGQCLPLCDEESDCPPGTECDTSDPGLIEFTGRAGMCWPTEEAVQAAIEANGGASSLDGGTPTDAAPDVTDPMSTDSAVGDAG